MIRFTTITICLVLFNSCSLRPDGMLDTVINQKDVFVEPKDLKPDNHLGNPDIPYGILRGKVE